MIALYTETLKQYIENGGNTFENRFKVFPIFSINEEVYDLYTLFIEKYKYREIGAETEELFEYYLGNKINEVNIKYANKVRMYLDNFSKLLSRVVDLENSGNGDRNSGNKNSSYVNPLTTNNPKLQDYTDGEYSDTTSWTEKRQQAYGYFKSNPEIMKAFLEIENIYYTALEEFNNIFIGVF